MGDPKKIREALARVEDPLELLVSVFSSAPVALTIVDADGKNVIWNDAFTALYGEIPEGYTLFNDPTFEAQGGTAAVRRAFAGESVSLGPLWYGKDPTERVRLRDAAIVAEGIVFPVRDGDGVPRHVAFATRDVKAEMLLRASLAELERFRDAGIMGVAYWTSDGKITFANDAFLEMLQLTREDVLEGRVSWAELTPPEHARLDARALDELRERGKCTPYEKEFVRGDGRRVAVLCAGAALDTDDGSLRGISFMLDLTERNALHAQFVQAQKMEAIGRLAGGVAHDFNNMLSAILGFAGIVQSELRPNDPLASDVKEIITAAERASSLTRQLLAFSRKQILEPKLLDLSHHVGGMEQMLRRLIGEDVQLVLSLATNLAAVRVDPVQVEQVVLNLVINARDAIEGDGGRITIDTANVQLDEEYARQHVGVAPGSYVMLSVSDTGQGIDAAVRERIFEPFFTTKALGEGTGLGLATVFGIVRQSGGYIWVYSEPGQGTTFKVYFPRAATIAPPEERGSIRPAPRRGTETILLVEDEAGVRAFVKRALQREGYVVLEASNGGEALLIAEQHVGPIALLLTDVVMPRMNGRALYERLQKVMPDLQVVYMSGYTENTIVHQGVLDEGTNFIPKPISLDVLRSKIRSVLDAAGSLHGQQ